MRGGAGSRWDRTDRRGGRDLRAGQPAAEEPAFRRRIDRRPYGRDLERTTADSVKESQTDDNGGTQSRDDRKVPADRRSRGRRSPMPAVLRRRSGGGCCRGSLPSPFPKRSCWACCDRASPRSLSVLGHGFDGPRRSVPRVYGETGLLRSCGVRHEVEAVHAATALRWVTGEKAAIVTSIGPGRAPRAGWLAGAGERRSRGLVPVRR